MIEMERPKPNPDWNTDVGFWPIDMPVDPIDKPLDPPVTTMPIETPVTDVIDRPRLPWEQYAGKLAPIVDGEIKAWNSDWGEQPRDPRDVFAYDDPIMRTMANGGEVQYLRGGGSTLGEMRRRYDVKAAKNEGALNEIRDRVARMLNPNVAEGSTPDMANVSSEGGIMAAIMELLKKAPLFNQGEWDKFNTSLDDSGIQEMISSARKKGSNMLETVKKGLPRFPINRAYGGQVGIGSFANGGPVQYLRGGGPTRKFSPSGPSGLLPHSGTTSGKKEKDWNEDKTIPKTIASVTNAIKNLISGGSKSDANLNSLINPGGLNILSENKIPTFEGKVNKQVPKINMDILDMPAPMDISSSPEAGGINMGILDMPAPMDIQSNIQSLVGGGRGADPRNFMQGNAGRGDDPRKFMYQGDAGRGGDPRDFMYQGDAGRGSDPRDFMTEPVTSTDIRGPERLLPQSATGTSYIAPTGPGGDQPLLSGIASVDPVVTTETRADVPSDSAAPRTALQPPARLENMTQIGGYNDRTGWMDQISRGNTIDPVSGYPYSIMISASRVGMTPEEYSNLSFGEKMDLFGKEMEVQKADMAYGLRKHATALKNFDFTAPVDNYGAMSQGREGSTYRGPINTGGGNFFQEMIDKIIPPSEDAEEIPTPTPTATGGYTCPDGWLYDANTSSCVKQGKGFGGQGMNMGGAVSPSLNNAVDNFIQALA